MVPSREALGGVLSRDDGLAGARCCQAVIVLVAALDAATKEEREEGADEAGKGMVGVGVAGSEPEPAGRITFATRRQENRQKSEEEGHERFQLRGEAGGEGERKREREEEAWEISNSRERKA